MIFSFLKKIVKIVFVFVQTAFCLAVILGEYRKFFVFCYLTFENFYDGQLAFEKFIMIAEAIFLVFFSSYLFFILYYFRLADLKLSVYDLFFLFIFFMYLVFFLMIEELYS